MMNDAKIGLGTIIKEIYSYFYTNVVHFRKGTTIIFCCHNAIK